MHLLRKMRGGNEKRLPELWWGSGAQTATKVKQSTMQ
jgi:hypothetical protein